MSNSRIVHVERYGLAAAVRAIEAAGEWVAAADVTREGWTLQVERGERLTAQQISERIAEQKVSQ